MSAPILTPSIPFTQSARRRGVINYLRTMGAGSLTLSLFLHGLGLALFMLWITVPAPEPQFISCEGFHQSVSNAQNRPGNLRKRVTSTARIGSITPESAITLPDLPNPNPLNALNTVVSLGGQTGGPLGGLGPEHSGSGLTATGVPSSLHGPSNFLHLPANGNVIIFAIDTSGSMLTNCKPAGIAALRHELALAITGLPSSSQFNLICFGQDADLFQPQCVSASAANKSAALEFFQFYYQGARTRTEKFGLTGRDSNGIAYTPLKPADVPGMTDTSGGSRMDLALTQAFTMNASTIFLLSDGEPTTSRNGKVLDKSELLQFMEKSAHTASAEKTIVNTIAVNPEARTFLRKIAHRFNGKFKEVNVSD